MFQGSRLLASRRLPSLTADTRRLRQLDQVEGWLQTSHARRFILRPQVGQTPKLGRSSSRFWSPLKTIKNPAAHVTDIPSAS